MRTKRRHPIVGPLLNEQLKARDGNCFFLQIGANDGIDGDPIHDFICEFGWRGVLVEPLPDIFAELVKNYEAVKGLKFVNAAVTKHTGTVAMWRHPVHSSCSGLVVRTQRQRNAKMQEILVPSISLRDLLLSIQRDTLRLDLLQIDVEGYDAEIIKMWCWDLFVPHIIHYENKHLLDSERSELTVLLSGRGYRMFSEGVNMLCVLE